MALEAARCPECAADIQVPTERDVATCMYCGRDIIVRQAVSSGGPSTQNLMTLAEAAAEAGNHDEAYTYYTRVLELDPNNSRAWLGKAIAAGWSSNLQRDRYSEMASGMERAIKLAPASETESIARDASLAITEITIKFYTLSHNRTAEYIALDDTWAEHVGRCRIMLHGLKLAHRLWAENKVAIEQGIAISKHLIEGVAYDDPYDTDSHGNPNTKVLHLTPRLEEEIRSLLDEFVTEMQKLDASYQKPEIEKASDDSTLTCIVALVMLAAISGAIYWFISRLISG